MTRAAVIAGAALLTGMTPAGPRLFVEQGVARGARMEVMVLTPGGDFARVTAAAGRGPDGLPLDTDRGYWLHCGRWRADGAAVAVHQQLAESFRFFPPPRPGTWEVRRYAASGSGGTQRLAGDGKRYARAARAPLAPAVASSLDRLCAGAREREPRWD
jgi:hypothetical protein